MFVLVNVGGWSGNLELLNLSRLFTKMCCVLLLRRFRLVRSRFRHNTLSIRTQEEDKKACKPSTDNVSRLLHGRRPLTLSLNIGKTIVKVKYLLASMAFLCWRNLLCWIHTLSLSVSLGKLIFPRRSIFVVCFISCLRGPIIRLDSVTGRRASGFVCL